METIVLDGEPDVGRKKTPVPETAKGESSAIHVRGSKEWIAWVDDWAAQGYMKPPQLIEMALAELARSRGHKEPPKR